MEPTSAKLQALAAAQERQREAEARVEEIDKMQKSIDDGRIQRVIFSIIELSMVGVSLTESEHAAITEGLSAVREKAVAAVEDCAAEVEGMLR